MPKLDLVNARQIKGSMGEVLQLKGAGFSWTKPGGLPSDTILSWKAGSYSGPTLTGGMPTVVDGALRFPGGLATTYALGQQMSGFYACIRGRNVGAATNYLRQIIGLTINNNSFSSTSRFDLSTFVNGFTVRHNPNNGEVSSFVSGLTLSQTITAEAWIIAGQVGIAINGTLVQSNPTGAIVQTSNIVLMNSSTANSDYDMNGMIVMGRMPTAAERTEIRAWVA